ncbi:hypothetical protein M408DRAFT_31260 [Serendipita vermifera MAFF 305830]|uniref:Uncharacterized protein n=1 Tax=Serendipita vermifera MAFF 305830 TaxID=933852 RepID=A0A0C3AH13_SERVB|nr:hypothetical protein M408DRAFT_31260 [Serendipita vermifera MAFF 305830]
MRKESEVSAYKNEVFNTSGDETWSTLPTKKKLPTKNINTFAKGKLTTGGFRLPGLGIPNSLAAASKRSPQPKVTMLTLYQPPPLPSKTRRRSLKSNKQAASDASGETVSGTSGSSDGDYGYNTDWELKAVSWPKDDSHTEEIQSDFPCWEDDDELPSTVQERKRGVDSGRDDTLAHPGVPPNDPYELK